MADAFALPGLVTVEHTIPVPLDHGDPSGPQIEVFAREVAHPDGRDRPYLVYFQGGPGFEAPRPNGAPTTSAWITRALRDFRVLMLDQRGTGRSTPVGTLDGMAPDAQADLLAHFRADSIVRDAEVVREALGVERWSVLGQSFGGFCVTAYLSIAPDGLREALITGGVPALEHPVDEIYAQTFRRVRDRCRRLTERYPTDADRLQSLRTRAQAGELRDLEGRPISWPALRQIGSWLGMSDGAEAVHHLLELPPDSPAFRHDAFDPLGFSRNPLYALVHEACWADGGATNWAAARVLPEDYATEPLLTGEHIFPSVFEEYPALAPLREAAERLAAREWPRLYDLDTLRANEVPVAAAIYAEDMYVDRIFSEETAARIGRMRAWVTSEYEHNGLRADGARIVGRLLDLVRGRA
jgi:pimeloyl-ACP methyl ester carboxylesterase